jgi:hypothetical protein
MCSTGGTRNKFGENAAEIGQLEDRPSWRVGITIDLGLK